MEIIKTTSVRMSQTILARKQAIISCAQLPGGRGELRAYGDDYAIDVRFDREDLAMLKSIVKHIEEQSQEEV